MSRFLSANRLPLLSLLVGLLSWTAANAADNVDQWQRQWNYVLQQMLDESESAHGRAAQLLAEATRLRDAAQARLAHAPDGALHSAVGDYERAQLSFDKARQAVEHAQRMLRDIELELRRANPGNLSLLDDDVRKVFQRARRQLTQANNAMRAGVSDYNSGLRHFDDAPGKGAEGLAEFVREQSQEKAFRVTRLVAQTKSALIELRDQRRFLKDPACEDDIRGMYQSILDTLASAHRGYLDADSVPEQSDQAMAQADAAFERAREQGEEALTRFENCLRR